MAQPQGTTREIRTHSIGDHDPGDIWANRQDGIFVVVSSRLARWRGEDIDVYAHIDTWYTIRDATPDEVALWNAAVDAARARKALRSRLGACSSHQYDAASRRLISTMTRLDSYDDRWNPPDTIVLDDEAVAIETNYLVAVANLKGHTG